MFILILICILCFISLILGQVLKSIFPEWGIDAINADIISMHPKQRRITIFKSKKWLISILFGMRK